MTARAQSTFWPVTRLHNNSAMPLSDLGGYGSDSGSSDDSPNSDAMSNSCQQSSDPDRTCSESDVDRLADQREAAGRPARQWSSSLISKASGGQGSLTLPCQAVSKVRTPPHRDSATGGSGSMGRCALTYSLTPSQPTAAVSAMPGPYCCFPFRPTQRQARPDFRLARPAHCTPSPVTTSSPSPPCWHTCQSAYHSKLHYSRE